MQNLNGDMTEFIVFKSKRNVNMCAAEGIHVRCIAVEISPKVKIFDIIFDLFDIVLANSCGHCCQSLLFVPKHNNESVS